MDSTRHWGRVAIVTGAGSGIGRATVIRLALEGASVVGCDIDAEALHHTRQALAELGFDADFRQADITVQEDVDLIIDGLPRIDVLVNSAGVMDHFLPITEMSDDEWARVIDVNITGAMRMTRAVLFSMMSAGRGSVVTIGSEALLRAGVSGCAYATSKHALLGLVHHVAYFYGPDGVRSNAVLHGAVSTTLERNSTPLSPWAFERARSAMATSTSVADPDDVAAVVSWLACDESRSVNGAVVTADGGRSHA